MKNNFPHGENHYCISGAPLRASSRWGHAGEVAIVSPAGEVGREKKGRNWGELEEKIGVKKKGLRGGRKENGGRGMGAFFFQKQPPFLKHLIYLLYFKTLGAPTSLG